MIKTPAPLRVNIDSHPSGILIHIATERLFSSLESAPLRVVLADDRLSVTENISGLGAEGSAPHPGRELVPGNSASRLGL